MKFSPRAFRAFWDVHAWFGVVASLALHVMFLAGAVALFRAPLELWQEPALHVVGPPRGTLEARVSSALATAPTPPDDFWLIFDRERPSLEELVYFGPDGDSEFSFHLVTREGTPVAAREGLADFLFQLHYLRFEFAPWMQWVGAALGVVLLLLVVSGLLIQLHNLVRQFHQFRLHKGPKVMWSDLHKVLGVMGLPFQTFYAFTGALILLLPVMVDVHAFLARAAGRGGGEHIQELARFEPPEPPTPTGAFVPVRGLDELLDVARREVPGMTIETVNVRGHRREDGWLVARGRSEHAPLFTSSVWVRERDGAVLGRATVESASAYKRATSWLTSVHYAHFGDGLVKALLVVLALAGCATILSGNVIWLSRRRAESEKLSFRILERLNVGVGAGAFVAIAASFVASRLLPLAWEGRVAGEQAVFFLVLGGAVMVALVEARSRLRALWWKQLAVAAVSLVFVPVCARRWSAAGLLGDAAHRVPTVAAVDVVLFVAGTVLALLALRIRAGRGSSHEERSASGVVRIVDDGKAPASSSTVDVERANG